MSLTWGSDGERLPGGDPAQAPPLPLDRNGAVSDPRHGLEARGPTTRQIADELVISPKTADHHIQHVYGKIGVSTRGAPALWAMQNPIVT